MIERRSFDVMTTIIPKDAPDKQFDCRCVGEPLAKNIFLRPFINKDWKLGFFDENGLVVIPPIYDWEEDFTFDDKGLLHDKYFVVISKKYLRLKKDGLYGLINLTNYKTIIGFKWHFIDTKTDNDCIIVGSHYVSAEMLYGMFNLKSRRLIIRSLYDEIKYIDFGKVLTRHKNRWGMLDLHGKLPIPFEYLNPFTLHEVTSAQFAIVHEGSDEAFSDSPYSLNSKVKYSVITDKNVKLIDKADFIRLTGEDNSYARFVVTRGDTDTITLIIFRHKYIIKLEDAEFEEGYVELQGTELPVMPMEVYKSGGVWSACNHDGEPLEISPEEIEEEKQRFIFFGRNNWHPYK